MEARTPLELVEQARSRAYSKEGLTYTSTKAADGLLTPAASSQQGSQPGPKGHHLLVPVFIGADVPIRTREQFLWRLGESGITPSDAAAKFCYEMQYDADLRGHVEAQINASLERHTGWNDLGGEKLVQLRVKVRRGSWQFVDDITYDLNAPNSSAEAYACQVCTDLGLDCVWWDTIRMHLHALVKQQRELLAGSPASVALVASSDSILREAPLEGFPRIERVTGAEPSAEPPPGSRAQA